MPTTTFQPEVALIVGAGPGLGSALARAFAGAGIRVALAARSAERLRATADEIGAQVFACDAADGDSVERLFEDVDRQLGSPDVVVFNPSLRVRGPLADLPPDDVRQALAVTAFGGFLVARQATRRMLATGRGGAILFTGASASVKGYARSAPFAMAKFALRGLAQSAARELAPQGIHVAHFVIDGAIGPVAVGAGPGAERDDVLDPDAIAATYLHVLRQPRSAWTWEVELRPSRESF